MRLERPTLPRALTMVVYAATMLFAPAAPAQAHNGAGGSASDYRSEIIGYSGDPTGIELRVVELGNRMELVRTTANTVVVLGYEGEPYLRFDASGIFENINSPAHYLNLDRFAATSPPASASATAQPSWMRVASGTTFRWHDHRAHWMSPIPPTDVQADPDVERVVHTDTVALQIDGRDVEATIRVTWLPKPDRLLWLVIAVLLAAIVAATIVLVRGADRYLPLAVVAASVAVMFGAGDSGARAVLSGVAIVAALVGVFTRLRLVSVGAAVLVSLLAATRLDVFDHELIAGWIAAPGQRLAIVIAFGFGLGSVAASIVSALSPSPAPPPTALEGVADGA